MSERDRQTSPAGERAAPAPRPLFLSHPVSLEHDTGSHPENIRRLVAVEAELERQNYLGWQRLRSPAAALEQLERVHPAAYINSISELARAGGGQLDADTVVSSGSYDAALHAAGGAIELVDRLFAGGALGFSAHRPPGHHALASRAMGFCLFNNIALAAHHALDAFGLERVLILDWDVHHGNGTQEIFYEDRRVLFCSIHQYPFWPGSGRGDELGRGDGRGHTINLPVPAGSGDGTFVSLVRDVAAQIALQYEPQLILVSAGYDAHRDDPLGACNVTDAGFATMAATARDLAVQLRVPLGFVLEGGYDPGALARCVVTTMRVCADAGPAREQSPGYGIHPLAAAARERLSGFWPTLR